MLRVNSSNVLVVPPFECAWVLDENKQLKDNAGCVSFEAKGDNDATLILKPKPGSKRWQHQELGGAGTAGDVNQNYTIIFGSHQNSCLRIEKDLQECYREDKVASISGNDFVTCWVDYNNGTFKLGVGKPGCQPCYCWTDSEPIKGIQHVGLSSWDKHVCFRNISVQPPLSQGRTAGIEPGEDPEQACSSVQPLAELCKKAIVAEAQPSTVCMALLLVDTLSPALDEMASSLIGFLASSLEQTMDEDPEGFQALPATLLAELLGNPCLECRERRVFDAVMLWAYDSPATASDSQPQADHRALVSDWADSDVIQSDEVLVKSLADVEALLLLVRFPLMSQKDLQSLRDHKFTLQSPLLEELLAEAQQAQMHQATAPEGCNSSPELAVEGKRLIKAVEPSSPRSSTKFQRRHSPASHNLMFVSSGDTNGVTHWLGTCYGTQRWVNPVLSGMMEVHASSPCCKQTDPKAVVGRNFLRLNQAGPGKTGTWWLFDLGHNHRLICNYYSVRHDASFDFARTWYLQGSTDGIGWVDLRRHTGDASICMPQQCFSWPVAGHAASMPYRLFRLLLQGPTTAAAGSRRSLHLSMVELYGHFFRIK